MSIRLRPHHVLCSVGLRGEGYDGPFVANMSHITNEQLRGCQGLQIQINITGQADSICAPCPHRIGLRCSDEEEIARLDAAHGAALGIAPGQTLSWGECLERARNRVAPDDLDRLCEGCRWLPMGICKRAVADLQLK
ncbi:DUF1284 domain-containing protein [Jannaschia faecimaris]|uniref:DUF1284 domain-containing protein n=1 Tax=Jannaschia faecimaris TaxID=1244108 RepID=UPI000B804615|nr:DUF1284 domain-containing protein [Jannaschia faecimaris]